MRTKPRSLNPIAGMAAAGVLLAPWTPAVASAVPSAPESPASAPAAAADPAEGGSTFFLFDTEPQYQFEFNFFPTSTAIGDLNADGALDLVVSGRNVEGLVAVFMGDGGAVWDNPTFVEVGRQTNSVELRDFDADGVLDMVVAVRAIGGRVIVLRGVGDGTFVDARPYAVRREVADIAVDDFTGDGLDDIAISGYLNHEVTLLAGQGDGRFVEVQRVPVGVGLQRPARPFWLESGDIDGDGRPDLLASHFGSGHLSIMRQTFGGLEPARRILIGTLAGLAITDADGDGLVDILTPTWDFPTSNLSLLRASGTPTFDRSDYSVLDGFYLWAMIAADLDADGRDEGVLTEALSGRFNVFANQSTPGSPAFSIPQFFGFGMFPWHLLPVDFDDDCDIDLVVCDIGSHRLGFFANFTEQVGCAVADLDGDGQSGVGDMMRLFRDWGRGGGPADLDRDGVVGPQDLIRLVASWPMSGPGGGR